MRNIKNTVVLPGIADRSRKIFIHVGQGITCSMEGRCVVIAAEDLLPRLTWLAGGSGAYVIPVASSENTKSVAFRDTCIAQYGDSLRRMDTLIVVGGGTVLNFATALASKLRDMSRACPPVTAATFKIVLVPTTLLAMADAAYGSSGLLNDGATKNAVSLKLDPDAIIIDKAHLATLPVAEKKRGLSECLKHAVLQQSAGQPDGAPSVEECLGLLRCPNPDDGLLLSCVLRTINARAAVAVAVNAGNSLAANLPSYGHLDVEPREAASSYRLSHGDAVLLGLMTEISLAGLTDLAAALRGVVPFTPLAETIEGIDFDREAMLDAYRHSARQRFRVGEDRYRIIRLGKVGEFAQLDGDTPVSFTEYSFRSIYAEVHRQLAWCRFMVRDAGLMAGISP